MVNEDANNTAIVDTKQANANKDKASLKGASSLSADANENGEQVDAKVSAKQETAAPKKSTVSTAKPQAAKEGASTAPAKATGTKSSTEQLQPLTVATNTQPNNLEQNKSNLNGQLVVGAVPTLSVTNGNPNLVVLDPNAPLELFCFCRKPETNDMIACDECEDWFHPACFNINLVSVHLTFGWIIQSD